MKLRAIIPFLLTITFLVSCTPRTLTSASTNTLTAIPTATTEPTITPTIAPQSLADAPDLPTWVEEFVHAYGGKVTVNGVEMDAEQLTAAIRQNPDEYLKIKTINGLPYAFVVINEVPLGVEMDHRWQKTTLKQLGMMNEMLVGISYNGNETDLVESGEFSAATLSPMIFDENGEKVGLDILTYLNEKAENEKILFYGPHLFWHWLFRNSDPDLSYLMTADKSTVEKWMKERIKNLFTDAPNMTLINISNEPVYDDNGNIGWEDSPMYRIFGTDWIRQAWLMAEAELKSQGKEPGKDVSLILNDYGIETDNAKFRFYLDFGQKLKKQLLESGITTKDPFAFGLQFHIRTEVGPENKIQFWIPALGELSFEQLKSHFEKIGSIAPIYITELSIVNGYQDPTLNKAADIQTQAQAYEMIIRAAAESKVVRGIIFWEPTWETEIYSHEDGQPTQAYYSVLMGFYEALDNE